MIDPIFVTGFQRSGTTLLQALLGAHPDVAAAPETHFVFRIWQLRDYYGDLSDDARLERVVHDLLHPPIPLLVDCGFDAQRVLRRARSGPRTYAAVLDALLGDYAQRHGAARWSEKTPGQPLADVLELFPSAAIVHIRRDPYDTIASCLATPWNDRTAAELAGQLVRFDAASTAAAAALPDDQYVDVRYEDLVRAPRSELARLCRRLRLPPAVSEMLDPSRRGPVVPAFARAWLDRVDGPVADERIGHGRARLTPQQRTAVRRILRRPARTATAAPPDSVPSPAERYRRTQQFFVDLGRRCSLPARDRLAREQDRTA